MRVGIITVSDRSYNGQRDDLSGPLLARVVNEQGWHLIRQIILPDDFELLKKTLVEWADCGQMDVVLTTGGTGFSPRDITPEATQAIIQRPSPGLVEAMRANGLKNTPHAMLSRAVAGIRYNTLIINLPGSPKGALESLQVIQPVLPHAVQLLGNDPNAEAGHYAG